MLRFKELTVQDPTINRVEINKRIAEIMGFKDLDKLFVPKAPTYANIGMNPDSQQTIQQRLAEGATPQQIKLEMLGPRPQGGAPGGQGGPPMDPQMMQQMMQGQQGGQ